MKKLSKILICLSFIFCAFIVVGCNKDEESNNNGGGEPEVTGPKYDTDIIYVAPNGKATNDGTIESSPIDITTAVANVVAGQTIKLLPRTTSGEKKYALVSSISILKTINGTADKYITLDCNGCLLDFSAQPEADASYGIKLAGSYWHIKNGEVYGAGDNGILVGGNYNIVENMEVSECNDTGIQIARTGGDSDQPTIDTWPSNNIIKNCTSHDNHDSGNEDADGFAAKLTVGFGNVFDGCISYSNIDDGWDLYAKAGTGTIGSVYLYNCVSYHNGMLSNGYTSAASDGNGYKLGGEKMVGEVYVENCLAFNNLAHGFTDNSNPGIITMKNCTAFDNGIRVSTKAIENFKVARSIDDITSNSFNYYEGLLSFYSSNFASISMNTEGELINSQPLCVGDEFKGVGLNSLLVSPVDGKTYVKFESVNSVDSRSASLCGKACDFDATLGKALSTITTQMKSEWFVTTGVGVNAVTSVGELKTLWRNSDGSINMGGFGDSDSTIYGCDLNKASQAAYSTRTFMTPGENETADDEKLRSAYDQLSIPGDQNYILNVKALNLPKSVYGCSVTWKSSNTSVCSIDANGNATIVNDKAKDNNFTLTATITYNSNTIEKEFDCTRIKFVPLIGEVANYSISYVQKQNGSLEEATNDFTKLKVYDRNTEELLTLNTDYTISVQYSYLATGSSTEVSVDSVNSANPGVYFVKWTITSASNSESFEVMTQKVTIVGDTDTLKLSNESISGISDGKITVLTDTSWKEGTVYLVAVDGVYTASTGITTPTWTPTADMILNNTTDGSHSYLYREEITLDSFVLSTEITNIGDSCVIYVVTKSYSNVISPVTSYSRSKLVVTNVTDLYNAVQLTNVTIKLGCDIDCTGFDWVPVYFNGNVLDGAGYTIKNLTITSSVNAGMFLEINDSSIVNLNFSNCTITAESGKAGILAATTYNGENVNQAGYEKPTYPGKVIVKNIKIDNCSISGSEAVGGLFGHTGLGNTTIDTVMITNTSISCSTRYSGGIIGWADDRSGIETYVSNCLVADTVKIYCGSSGYISGIVARYKDQGDGAFEINHCIFSGTLLAYGSTDSTDNTKYIGGLLGGLTDTISESNVAVIKNSAVYSKINIENASDQNSGSIAGRISVVYVDITNCYTFGDPSNYNGKKGSIDNATTQSVATSSFTAAYLIEKLGLDTSIWGADSNGKIIIK